MKLVCIEKDENIKIDKKLYMFLNPDYIYIPIYNEKVLVEQDALVYKNEVITGPFSKIASSISGKVLGHNKSLVKNKNMSCVVIENDYREKTKSITKIRKSMTIEIILKVLEKSDERLFNIFKSLTTCNNIIINAINDEPYVINNIITLKENINDVLEFIDELSILYKSKNNSIVIKSNESEIIDECLNVIGTFPNINLTLVSDEYLLGKKEFLLSKLRIDMNKTLCLNIQEIIKLIKLIKYNKIESTKIITISGDAIKQGKVIRVKKFVKLKDIISKFIDFSEEKYILVANSLLNGFEVNEDLIITDDINSIHIMKKSNIFEAEECVRCGKCLNICPVGANPMLALKTKKPLKECIRCGLCTYICPSYIPLRKYVEGETNEK